MISLLPPKDQYPTLLPWQILPNHHLVWPPSPSHPTMCHYTCSHYQRRITKPCRPLNSSCKEYHPSDPLLSHETGFCKPCTVHAIQTSQPTNLEQKYGYYKDSGLSWRKGKRPPKGKKKKEEEEDSDWEGYGGWDGRERMEKGVGPFAVVSQALNEEDE